MVDCTAAGPKTVASRTPDHGSGGSGAAKRPAPAGGRANGTPRNTERAPSEVPLSRPAAVSTVGATGRGPYRPQTRHSPPAGRCLPGGGSEDTYSGRGAASVPLTTVFIGRTLRRPERGPGISCQFRVRAGSG